MKVLTKKEKIVLEGIRNFFARKGMMPTIRELQKEVKKIGLKVKSSRSVFLYLSSLEKKGAIERSGRARGIKIIERVGKNFVDVPILGMADAGMPTFYAEENLEGYLKVSKNIVKDKELFAIQVKGTSMNLCRINAKRIENNDYVIVDRNDRDFRNGNKVLVIVDGLATVKLYRKIAKDRIGLFPVSTDVSHRPIYLTPSDEFIINGKVIDVLKNTESGRYPEYIDDSG